MDSKKLVRLYIEYMDGQTWDQDDRATDDDPIVTLFGSDQFKISVDRGQVWTSAFGWLDCPGIDVSARKMDWVAVIRDQDGFRLTFGMGTPYMDGLHLPSKNGKSLAIPFSFMVMSRIANARRS